MLVEFVGRKAQMANEKHFGGKLTIEQMKQLVVKTIKNAKFVGESDRANQGHIPAKIVWGEVHGIMIGLILDGKDIRRNKATVVSIYDVQNAEHKAKRFNMRAL